MTWKQSKLPGLPLHCAGLSRSVIRDPRVPWKQSDLYGGRCMVRGYQDWLFQYREAGHRRADDIVEKMLNTHQLEMGRTCEGQ